MADPGTDWSNPVVPTADSNAAFPTVGGSSSTQDSIYGLSAKLAIVPVKIRSDKGGMSLDPQSGTSFPVTWESARALFDHMTPAERAQVQDQLYQAGFYPKSYYGKNPDIIVPGEADPTSRAAWNEAVDEAVRGSSFDKTGQLTNAKSVDQVIQERIALTQRAGTAAAGKQNPAQLTNPADLETVLHNAAQNVLGFAPSPSDLTNFVNIYHGQETAAAQQDPTTGNMTQAPNAAAYAEQWLRDRYPVEAGVNKTLNVGNEIVNRLGANAGGALPTNSAVTSGG
jgi:hypothetical protein